MIKYLVPFLCAASFCTAHLQATSCLHHAQETPMASPSHTPLKRLSSFVVLPIFSINDPLYGTLYQKSYDIVKTELEKMGTIQEVPMTYVKGIALSGVFLVVNVQKVPTLENKGSALTKVSLIVETMATVDKTNIDCMLPLWTRSLFLEEGSAQNIQSSIENLLEQFSMCYMSCNSKEPHKPLFYLYQP